MVQVIRVAISLALVSACLAYPVEDEPQPAAQQTQVAAQGLPEPVDITVPGNDPAVPVMASKDGDPQQSSDPDLKTDSSLWWRPRYFYHYPRYYSYPIRTYYRYPTYRSYWHNYW